MTIALTLLLNQHSITGAYIHSVQKLSSNCQKTLTPPPVFLPRPWSFIACERSQCHTGLQQRLVSSESNRTLRVQTHSQIKTTFGQCETPRSPEQILSTSLSSSFIHKTHKINNNAFDLMTIHRDMFSTALRLMTGDE